MKETCAQLLQNGVSRIFVLFTSESEKPLDPSAASTQPEEFALNIMNFTMYNPSKICLSSVNVLSYPSWLKG